jgi:hypothetical protein
MWQLIPRYPNLTIILGDGNPPTDEVVEKHFDTTDKSKVMLHKVIRGDSGDNVKSVYRFQFKKNLDCYLDCDGTPEGFLRLMIKRRGEDHKDVKKLFDYIKLMILNWKVVRLVEDLEYEYSTVVEPNRDGWNKLCRVYETPSLYNSPLLKIY